MPSFNSRAFIGASLFCAVIVLTVTSIWLYTKQHSALIAVIHTMIGFTMLIVAIWHMVKNFKPLFFYLNPKKKFNSKYSVAMPIALCLSIYLVLSPILSLAPALQVYQFGQTLKATDKALEEESGGDKELKYIERSIKKQGAQGQTITVELKKGPYFMWPQYAFWLETIEGEFVQPLYVTSAFATNNFTNKVTARDPNQVFSSHMFMGEDAVGEDALVFLGEEPSTKDTRMRPESLPVFLHQLGVQADNGFYVPTDSKLAIDGYTGATMEDNFIYSVQLPGQLKGKYRVRFEINHSFDFNEFYSSDRFPEDPVYSGSGFSAQPSVIYQAIIDFDNAETLAQMSVVGRGHHSGQNGELYGDLENLTTALELVDRIIVSVSL
ncbi:hypothetical protein CWC18_07175 [Pseudoalteromonas aurantia]|uniref:hypothetical protein n=1 Tax=Pseudoalteromonas aurantia TaxID=43654 RepID=UPI00110BF7C7|nr:hypothetical protein [Pseudoalteromonas aurantia]TMO64066.1 hypothetical protein CWC18_07175 [Pseudoalteromonas aurantia]